MKFTIFLFLFSSASALAALPVVGPDYRSPSVVAPTAWRDAGDSVAWKEAAPSDLVARGAWWTLFNDPVLDQLEQRAVAANQDLVAALARIEQARAAVGVARSAYWPQVAANASAARAQNSETVSNPLPYPLGSSYQLPVAATWELDLFGRVRRLAEGARAEADAAAANFESLRLSLTAEVAADYFSLRALERERAILSEGMAVRRRALDLVQARRRLGAATDLDLVRAEAELASAEAEAADLENRRSTLQNALAVLVGENAVGFVVAPTAADEWYSPDVPTGLPSELLERRPDIAAAERALVAANARIGVAKAAFFPAISLSGSAGVASGQIDDLLRRDSRIWSIGPSLYLPIFQGGRNHANLERSRAAFDENVALFRQRVLVAFREVQDALTATRLLAEEDAAQTRVVLAARRALELAQTRYDSGFVSYLEVIDAQRTALAAERAATQLAARRLNTSVNLIKALGGGWHRPADVVALAVR